MTNAARKQLLTDEAPAIAASLAPVVRKLMLEEISRVAAEKQKAERSSAAEREIMDCCRRVAEAADRLAQAKFSGTGELVARKLVETEAARLRRAMARHGRYTGDAL